MSDHDALETVITIAWNAQLSANDGVTAAFFNRIGPRKTSNPVGPRGAEPE
jgi:hypothetical protein